MSLKRDLDRVRLTDQEKRRRDFLKSLKRPANFYTLTVEQQWQIDKRLGILDYEGAPDDITPDEIKSWEKRFGRPWTQKSP